MGRYLECDGPKGKTAYLKKNHDAKEISREEVSLIGKKYLDPESQEVLICVVENSIFEAALFIEEPQQLFNVLRSDDPRPMTFLTLNRTNIPALWPPKG